ncbi:unnamed protein product [Paramecium pentaurelia]|uniref:Uncharacterized protein n=1 Tax=Paramecium pentaurelia TaxID=43138 RepID=A0A8S1TGX6_9CILI|nr:unnamed protein product [Paramecium pentaurelia]
MGQSCMNKKKELNDPMLQSIKPMHKPKKPTWELHYNESRPETQEDLDFDIETRILKKKEVRFNTPEKSKRSFSQGVKYQKELLMKQMFGDMFARKKYSLIRSDRELRQKEYNNRINQTQNMDISFSPGKLSLKQIYVNQSDQTSTLKEEVKSLKSFKSNSQPQSSILKQKSTKAKSYYSGSRRSVRFQF